MRALYLLLFTHNVWIAYIYEEKQQYLCTYCLTVLEMATMSLSELYF